MKISIQTYTPVNSHSYGKNHHALWENSRFRPCSIANCNSHYHRIKHHEIPLNQHVPIVSLWFSYNFPIFLWFSYGFPMVSPWGITRRLTMLVLRFHPNRWRRRWCASEHLSCSRESSSVIGHRR